MMETGGNGKEDEEEAEEEEEEKQIRLSSFISISSFLEKCWNWLVAYIQQNRIDTNCAGPRVVVDVIISDYF